MNELDRDSGRRGGEECAPFEVLAARADEEALSEVDADRLERHLAGCPACRAAQALARELSALGADGGGGRRDPGVETMVEARRDAIDRLVQRHARKHRWAFVRCAVGLPLCVVAAVWLASRGSSFATFFAGAAMFAAGYLLWYVGRRRWLAHVGTCRDDVVGSLVRSTRWQLAATVPSAVLALVIAVAWTVTSILQSVPPWMEGLGFRGGSGWIGIVLTLPFYVLAGYQLVVARPRLRRRLALLTEGV